MDRLLNMSTGCTAPLVYVHSVTNRSWIIDILDYVQNYSNEGINHSSHSKIKEIFRPIDTVGVLMRLDDAVGHADELTEYSLCGWGCWMQNQEAGAKEHR